MYFFCLLLSSAPHSLCNLCRQFVIYNLDYLPSTMHCALPTMHFLLPTTYYALPTTYYALPTTYYSPRTAFAHFSPLPPVFLHQIFKKRFLVHKNWRQFSFFGTWYQYFPSEIALNRNNAGQREILPQIYDTISRFFKKGSIIGGYVRIMV